MTINIKHSLKAEVRATFISIGDMEELIAQARDLGFVADDHIHVHLHIGQDPIGRDPDWLELNVRKKTH